MLPLALLSQETNDTIAPSKPKLERPAFESSALIESQTNVVNPKGTLQMDMNHRFGLVTGTNDMIGIWAPANIRIAVTYSITSRIAVGFGTTKDKRLQDFNLKLALLRQTKGNKMPFSLSYYGNMAIDARTKDNFVNTSDRWSFYNQLIFARRFNDMFSFQIAPSFSHFNTVEIPMKNDMFSVELGARVKLNSTTCILLDYNQPLLSTPNVISPKPGVSIGAEFTTGAHAFQIFITNYRGIIGQENNVFNQNDFFKSDFVIGFNITRLWDM